MLEQVLGVLMVCVVLLDVFLTVLYARMGASLVSSRLARRTWALVRLAAKPFGRHQATVLALGGPLIVVLLVVGWAAGLTCGTAMILQPELGTAVIAKTGATPTDFVTALYAGGGTMAIGASDFLPRTTGLRLLFLWGSLVGTFVVTLTLSYLMQVYTALQRRNALGLMVDLLAAGTGDAGELLVRLAVDGPTGGANMNISSLAGEFTVVEEAHHLYPVLFYFRFREPCYSTSRFTLIALDMVALAHTALDGRQYRWLQESASLHQLSRASMLLATNLVAAFAPRRVREARSGGERAAEGWRRRYYRAIERLRRAGIETRADLEAGAAEYVALRAGWGPAIAWLAPFMAFGMDEVDPAGITVAA
jgi:hypothetical protein